MFLPSHGSASSLGLRIWILCYWTANEGRRSSPGDIPDPGMELGSPALQVDSLLTDLPGKPKMKGEKMSNRMADF